MSLRVGVYILAGLLAALASPCVSPPASAQSPRVPAATSGDTRVLVVFVRFSDDQTNQTGCRANRGWPLDEVPEPLPAYATTLFASDPQPPFPDSSATEYFYRQSNGRLVFYADVHPQVIVTENDASYYSSEERRGYGYLAQEVLSRIDDGVDFRRYDTNPRDGILDHVFIIVRRDDEGTFTGVADLRGADRVRGTPDGQLVLDGVLIDWSSSGSFIYNHRPGHIISQSYMVRMIAHEYGHHIWNPRRVISGHVPAIRSNKTPANDTNVIGYTLMAGRGGGKDARGDLLISAPERDAVGWLDPIVVSPESDSLRHFELGDLFSTGDAVRVDIPFAGGNGPGERLAFYFTNRQRVGWFDRYREDAPPGCPAYEMGLLRTTGLLAMLASWRSGRLSLDVLPADNTLNLGLDNETYEGDLYGSGGATQITPFTSPSTARPDGRPTWFAIDEIGMSSQDDRLMEFVFVPDFRERAVIRRDSRIDASFGPVVIRGDLQLTDLSTLTVEPGASLEIDANLVVDPGSSLLAMAGSRVTLEGTVHHIFADTALAGPAGVSR